MTKGSNFKLVSNILRAPWAIDHEFAVAQLPLIAAILSGQPFTAGDNGQEEEPIEAFYFNDAGEPVAYRGDKNNIPAGSVGVVYVRGALMKEDYCGDPGMATLAERVKELDANPNVVGQVHIHDSPGGTVAGTEHFANVVANTTKPVVGFVDGMAASASYWIISATDHIILGGQTARVGSIGTMMSLADLRPAYERLGVKFHDVLATASKNKNKEFFDVLKGDYKAVIDNMLDPMNEVFLAAVRQNRPHVKAEALTGKMYMQQSAIDAGLVDAMGTLEDAISKVMELANNSGVQADGAASSLAEAIANNPFLPFSEEAIELLNSNKTEVKSNSNKPANEMFNSKLDKAVNALAAKVKAGEEILAEDMAPVDAELKAKGLEGFAIAKEEVVANLEKEVSNLKAEKARLEKELNEAKQEVERLGELPGASHTVPAKPNGDAAHQQPQDPELYSEADAELDQMLNENE